MRKVYISVFFSCKLMILLKNIFLFSFLDSRAHVTKNSWLLELLINLFKSTCTFLIFLLILSQRWSTGLPVERVRKWTFTAEQLKQTQPLDTQMSWLSSAGGIKRRGKGGLFLWLMASAVTNISANQCLIWMMLEKPYPWWW